MNLSRVLLPVITLTLLAGLAGLLTDRPAFAGNPLPVTVTNVPLPIQGSVGITGTPSVNVANTAASPVLARNVDAGTLTHVGQKASNLVSLFTSSTIFANEGYRRIFADGSTAINFTTSAGQALVVTDLYYQCGQATPGSQIFFDLEPLVGPNTGGITMFETISTADTNGNAHAEQHLTTGLGITGTFSEPLSTHVQCGFWQVRVYGYLVPNL